MFKINSMYFARDAKLAISIYVFVVLLYECCRAKNRDNFLHMVTHLTGMTRQLRTIYRDTCRCNIDSL